ncbi:MAG: hypothetical protein A2654_00010 [Candidatus Nealsonbacteria bacterium RIFCSPHIGHO2_01_FULL_43_31]|uniref:Uncharacterized protein n=1 Tax=Candidatus Nealsonbacteria bacterium RIFCSPHIGHO2_01_FULL_43_31 TaxID=1801665 RepID=A0A1G2E3J7_9BACT|nr:MAG: hypothetical protein A2654_00010 [Candidatus Nealsonbacteria bacterium RIFCSPHIGHO2_01_FULL_43_31]
MKIILVATDSKTKSVVFVSDTGQVFSLKETVRLIYSKSLEGVYIVRGRYGEYIRSTPNNALEDNLDTLSVSGRDIILYTNQTKHAVSTPPISTYLEHYLASLAEGKPFIVPIGQKKVLVADIKSKFISHISLIITAAKEFDVDRYLLGAILIDEIARLHPFEEILDLLGLKILGRNVSVGAAQVKLETANSLIKKGLYNPNPDDKELPFSGTLSNKNREHLYQYVIQPKHNIRFAAAFIRSLIEVWATHIDITKRPEIIATLYSIGYGDPKVNPVASKAGAQIIEEFYPLAKKWLTDI